MGWSPEEHICELALKEYRRLKWVTRIRPARLGEVVASVVRNSERRFIVTTDWGILLYVDPLSTLGRSIISTGEYEPEIRQLLNEILRPGSIFVDLGANEGVFTCYAGRRVGPTGRVIAVEPQDRLEDVMRVNVALNELKNVTIVRKALSEVPIATLWLFPSLNAGASSVVRRYRWGSQRQLAQTISFSQLLHQNSVEFVDLVKIDVEGYEYEVVDSMLAAIKGQRVGALLVDYHTSILEERGLSSQEIDRALVRAGMISQPIDGALSGYVLYRQRQG